MSDMSQFNPQKPTLAEVLTDKDPDLKCPLHDAMSMKLSCEKSLGKIIASSNWFIENDFLFQSFFEIKIEQPVSKGSGKYYKLIGFMDCFARIRVVTKPDYDRSQCENIIIEAKPKITNPMEVLRQIKTYKEYIRESHSLLWCPAILDEHRLLFEKQGVYVSTISIEST